MPTIADKIIGGSFWVSVLRGVQKIFGALKQIILARLLFPEDFGLFGIATLMLLAFEVLTRTGFQDALIHIQEDIKDYLHTSYWIQVVRGAVIGLIVFIGAPSIAAFFDEPQVVPIVQVLALTEVLKGFRSIGIVLLRKEMDFRTESIFLFTGVLTNFFVTVILAFLWKNVWALVWGNVISEAVMVISSFYFHQYRPRFSFSWQSTKKLVRFGIWLLGAGVVSYISLQADNIFVGKLIGTTALGVYQMGYFLANLPTTEIVKQIGRVVQSSYAELQEDKELLKQTYQRTFTAILIFITPLIIGLILLNEELVIIILGEKWADIIPILPILAIGAFFRGLGTSTASLFKATGLTSYVFRVESLRAVTLLAGLAVCSYFQVSLVLISWVYVISTIIMFSYHILLYEKRYKGIRTLLYKTLPTLVSGGILIIYTIGLSLILNNGVLSLFFLVFSGLTIYIIGILIIEKKTDNKILLILLKRYNLIFIN